MKPCNSVGLPPAARVNRFEYATEEIPTHDQVCAIRTKKRLLISGADQFNIKPAKGIQFLQDNGVLSDPVDPQKIVSICFILTDNSVMIILIWAILEPNKIIYIISETS